MDLIVRVNDSKLFWDCKGYLSFTNSPFYGHKNLSAVDLYPREGCTEAESPSEGIVKFAEKLKIIDDYLIILQTAPDVYVKILHVKPCVDIGCKVSIGDMLGRYHWSPFFNPWTDFHMHVELRPSGDLFRARGAYELNIYSILNRIENSIDNGFEDIFRVVDFNERYYLLKNEKMIKPYTTPFTLKLGNSHYFLDGGIPHYGHGALICPSKDTCKIPNNFRVDFRRSQYIHFKCDNDHVSLRNSLWKGISAFINRPFLKLIPLRSYGNDLEIGSEISLKEISRGIPF
ncbi:hypothetical protein [[Eubacterium] cellulosolvens]